MQIDIFKIWPKGGYVSLKGNEVVYITREARQVKHFVKKHGFKLLNFGELGLKDVLVASVKGETTEVRSTYILLYQIIYLYMAYNINCLK